MFKKKKNISESEHREQYEYAQRRVKQKRWLMQHFIFFLAASIMFLIMDIGLKFGAEKLPNNWSTYFILFWFFIFLVHLLNVFLVNKFMGQEWENRQIEKLKTKQMERILELHKQVEIDYPLPANERISAQTSEDKNSTDTLDA